MPNYGLVVTPQYNPMNYEQYARPFAEYAQVYNQMADAFDALEMEANQWEKLANSDIDSPQYEQYKKYANDLRAAAGALSEHGLSIKTRGMVSDMRKRYASEIKPISDAYTLREEERKMQKQAQLQHPDIMFSRDAATTGLGAYMAGTPELQTYNGEMLAKYTANAAKNLAREARDELIKDGKRSGWYKILGEQYYEKAMRTGLTADEVMSALYDPATGRIKDAANPYLKKMLDDAILQSGMAEWSNWEDLKDRAYTYAGMGLWESIGQVDYKNLQNREWDLRHSGGGGGMQFSNWDDEDLIATDPHGNEPENEIRDSGFVGEEGDPILSSGVFVAFPGFEANGNVIPLFERTNSVTGQSYYPNPNGLSLSASEQNTMARWNEIRGQMLTGLPEGEGASGLNPMEDPYTRYVNFYNFVKEVGPKYGIDITKDPADVVRNKLKEAMRPGTATVTGQRIQRFKLDKGAGDELKKQLMGQELQLHKIKVKGDGTYEEVTGSFDGDWEKTSVQQLHYNQFSDQLTVQLLVDGKKQWYTMPLQFMGATDRETLTQAQQRFVNAKTDAAKALYLETIRKLLKNNLILQGIIKETE